MVLFQDSLAVLVIAAVTTHVVTLCARTAQAREALRAVLVIAAVSTHAVTLYARTAQARMALRVAPTIDLAV